MISETELSLSTRKELAGQFVESLCAMQPNNPIPEPDDDQGEEERLP